MSGIREDKKIGTVPRWGYEFKSPGRPIRGLVGALGSVKVAFPAHPQTILFVFEQFLCLRRQKGVSCVPLPCNVVIMLGLIGTAMLKETLHGGSAAARGSTKSASSRAGTMLQRVHDQYPEVCQIDT